MIAEGLEKITGVDRFGNNPYTYSPTPAFSSVLPTPNLISTDLANLNSVTVSFDSNSSATLSWVLYSESRWKEWQAAIV